MISSIDLPTGNASLHFFGPAGTKRDRAPITLSPSLAYTWLWCVVSASPVGLADVTTMGPTWWQKNGNESSEQVWVYKTDDLNSEVHSWVCDSKENSVWLVQADTYFVGIYSPAKSLYITNTPLNWGLQMMIRKELFVFQQQQLPKTYIVCPRTEQNTQGITVPLATLRTFESYSGFR